MSVVGPGWYSQNAVRNYPLADGPAALTEDGRAFPPDLVVDARVRADMGGDEWVELAGVTVGPALATAAFSVNGPGGRRAGGAAAVVGPVVPGRPYPVTPVAGGSLTGWVVFGPAVDTAGAWRLADDHCRLSSRAGQRLSQGEVPTITRLGCQDLLTGVVALLGGQDVSVTTEDKVVDGVTRPCVVLRLTADTDKAAVFQRYLGKCGARPESGTCDVPPVERIGPAVPDCDGNINIEFAPPLGAAGLPGGGLGIGTLIGLSELCDRGSLGSSEMPGDQDLACVDGPGSEGAGGNAGGTVVVQVTQGYEAGRTLTLDTGESLTLAFGDYAAVFRNVAHGARTIEVEPRSGETITWSVYSAGQSGNGNVAAFDFPPTRSFESVTFNIADH